MKRLIVGITALIVFGICAPASILAEVSVDPFPLIWGAGAQLGYRFGDERLPTTAEIGAAAAISTSGFFRTPDGSLYSGNLAGFDPGQAPYFSRRMIWWNTGLRQSVIVSGVPDKPFLEIFLRYVGIREWHVDDDEPRLLFDSEIPLAERDGQWLNTVRVGVEVGNILRSEISGARRGWDGHVTLEWGPGFLANRVVGEADFARVGTQLRGFVPLYEALPRISQEDGEELNRFALYAGAYAAADYAWGERVPLSARRSIVGPLFDRHGLGGSIRGYEAGRYDAQFKLAGSVELRAILPAIARPDVLPGLVTYFDAGTYRGFDDYESGADVIGTAYGAGGGISISLFDAVTLVFYTQAALDEPLVTGDRITPFAIGFGYHF